MVGGGGISCGPTVLSATTPADSVPVATTDTKGIRIPVPGYFEPVLDSPPSEGNHTPSFWMTHQKSQSAQQQSH